MIEKTTSKLCLNFPHGILQDFLLSTSSMVSLAIKINPAADRIENRRRDYLLPGGEPKIIRPGLEPPFPAWRVGV